MSRPLVTFALSAYNQERFVREAVEGALSQTYSPLEILLSDDCSTDRTFEIMREMAAAYRGPHKIVLNRNPKNLGTCAHLKKQFEMMSGEIYIGAAGDDVSLPERTEKVMAAFRAGGNSVQCVWSNAVVIDESGSSKGLQHPQTFAGEQNVILPIISTGNFSWLVGAAAAYRREVWDIFGPIHHEVMQEDFALVLRSRLLGKVVYLPDSLVLYRRHGGNLYDYEQGSCEEALGIEKQKRNVESLHRQRIHDLWTAFRLGKISTVEWLYYGAICHRCQMLQIRLDQVCDTRRFSGDAESPQDKFSKLLFWKTSALDRRIRPFIQRVAARRLSRLSETPSAAAR